MNLEKEEEFAMNPSNIRVLQPGFEM